MKKIKYVALSALFICMAVLHACGGSTNKDSNKEVRRSMQEQIEDTTQEQIEDTTQEQIEDTADNSNELLNYNTVIGNNDSEYVNQKRVTKTYVSSYAGEHYDGNQVGNQQYDYLFNWEWPETFKNEREEIFGLLNQIDGYELTSDEDLIKKGFKFIEQKEDGSFQKDREVDDKSILFYGDMNGNVPDGKGILIRKQESFQGHFGWYPYFAGNFVNGWIKGYGIRFVTSSKIYDYHYYGIGVVSEGNFNEMIGEHTGIYGGPLCGEGIIYYPYVEEYRVFKESITKPTIITNFVIKKPSVEYEGTFESGQRYGHVSMFARNYSSFEDEDIKKKDSDTTGQSCYGWLYYDGVYIDNSPEYEVEGTYYLLDGSVFVGVFDHYFGGIDCFTADGKLYDSQGRLRYEGRYSGGNEPPYIEGTLYDENGTLMGTYYRNEFTWADGYTPSENSSQEDSNGYSGSFLGSSQSEELTNNAESDSNIGDPEKIINPDNINDPGSYLCSWSNSEYMNEEQLKYLDYAGAEIVKDEIYARHRKKFNDEERQQYFNEKIWYVGIIAPESFDESVLNPFEKANIQVIDNYMNKIS